MLHNQLRNMICVHIYLHSCPYWLCVCRNAKVDRLPQRMPPIPSPHCAHLATPPPYRPDIPSPHWRTSACETCYWQTITAMFSCPWLSCADLCAKSNGGCHSKRKCVNTVGSAKCGDCAAGYTNDGAKGCKGWCRYVGEWCLFRKPYM